MPEINCRHFNGYMPCGKSDSCTHRCAHFEQSGSRILLIHLGALGAVVRSTSLLKSIREKYPQAHITWVTQRPADQLLRGNSNIDRVLTTDANDLIALSCLKFDVAFCIDKSLVAAGVLSSVSVGQVFGFEVDSRTGSILPANSEAEELWELGLSNFKKFHVNKKPETQLVTEALALNYKRDDYSLEMSAEELALSRKRREEWTDGKRLIVGINTGCSNSIPNKKLSVKNHRDLILQLLTLGVRIVLLGGSEDRIRNQQIAFGLDVVCSPTEQGLRDGLISIEACDAVITGDSLGMHMAIARKKWVVAWFGPTCAHEIDLFDRGIKVMTQSSCAPCWKRSCNKSPMCYDELNLNKLVAGVRKGEQWLTSSSTPRLSVISSSQFRLYALPETDGPTSA